MNKAMLQISLKIASENRAKAAAVYTAYRHRFLSETPDALQKELLIRTEDVQVLHGFDSSADAKAYLQSQMFTGNVCPELDPPLMVKPDVRIYESA